MKTYTFSCKYGNIVTIRVDMDKVRQEGEQWLKVNPKPEPPPMQPRYYRENRDEMLAIKAELGLSRATAIAEWRSRQEPVPNEKDAEYLEKLSHHNRLHTAEIARQMILAGCMLPTPDGFIPLVKFRQVGGKIDPSALLAINQACADAAVFSSLYYFILGNSELNEQIVMSAIDDLGYTWMEKPVIHWVESGYIESGHTSSTWPAMGAMAAKAVESMGPYKFKQLEIKEQAEILAIWLVDGWLTALRHKKAKEERDARKK